MSPYRASARDLQPVPSRRPFARKPVDPNTRLSLELYSEALKLLHATRELTAMRPTIDIAVKNIERATRSLSQFDSTTVKETIALVRAVAELRARIMMVGDRASRAQERENAFKSLPGGNGKSDQPVDAEEVKS